MNGYTPDGYVVAILGATGMVGKHLIEILETRNFPVKKLVPLASQRSVGETVWFNGMEVHVDLACPEAFDGVDIVLASAGGSVSETLAPEAVKRGATVIDNTSCFRMTAGVPLVVAGVNDEAIKLHQGIVANPNCSTAQLMPVLKTLHEAAGLKRVVVSTYQSVSGAGKDAMDELRRNTQEELSYTEGGHTPVYEIFQRPMAFNLIPHIDTFLEDDDYYGYTKEEVKLIRETRKILNLPHLKITATAVRVPVMIGHSESVTVDLDRPLPPRKAAKALSETPDVVVGEGFTEYHTPRETAGSDPVYVSRIRRDTSNPANGLNMWVVADNLRIGAALNAVRLAELLVKFDCVKPLPLPEPEPTPVANEVPPVAEQPAETVEPAPTIHRLDPTAENVAQHLESLQPKPEPEPEVALETEQSTETPVA